MHSLCLFIAEAKKFLDFFILSCAECYSRNMQYRPTYMLTRNRLLFCPHFIKYKSTNMFRIKAIDLIKISI
jgi:hypothetical protein